MEENRQIELRGEKVRNLVGHISSVLRPFGTSIIAISLLILLNNATFIPYQLDFAMDPSVN